MFQSLKAAISSTFEQVEDFTQTQITNTLLEWYPDSGTVTEILELIDNESNKLSEGNISHSMARANLKKSKYFSTSTTTASKYIPKRPRICII